jgi:hypothetical protein
MRPAGRRVDAVVRFCLFSCLVFTGCGGSPSTTPGAATTPSAAAPAISSIAPSNVPAGSTAFTLTVNGANFESTSVIEVGGVKEATTYVNANQLTTMMPASQIASGAELQVQVINGSVSSGTASGNQMTVTNPAPVGLRWLKIPQKLLTAVPLELADLPIDLDYRTELILRKAYLLANDWEIKDTELIQQFMPR